MNTALTSLTTKLLSQLLPLVASTFCMDAAAIRAATVATNLAAHLPGISTERGYVSSQQCAECHTKEHASWHRSYHRTMTQAALPENVLGPFDGSTVHSDGLAYRVFREGDAFWAEMPDPDVMMYIVQGGKTLAFDKVPRVRQRVVMATGSHHYQTYWVNSPRYQGLLQTLPLVYLIEDKRWVPRETAFMRGPDDEGRFITQWNHHCIRCHSTGGNPGLDEKTGKLETRVGELGIACEACHGPAQQHVELQRSLLANPSLAKRPDPITNPKKLDHRKASETCGQCHGVFIFRDEFAMQSAREGPLFKPGEDLHRARYYIQPPTETSPPDRQEDLRRNPKFFQERWWEDGTILAGGREFTALSTSGCYTKGEISCLSCHSMHNSDPNDQLKRFTSDNAQCTQCHTGAKFNSELSSHTFHRGESSGSNCLNCHMPHTTYALFKGIRSHQITSPGVAASARYGVPNACNLCHLDKTLDWTQRYLKQRYARQEISLSEEQKSTSAALLWSIKGHAAKRVITAWHFGWQPAQQASGKDWIAPFAASLLEDPYGVVRYVAARSLRTLPGYAKFEYDFLGKPDVLKQQAQKAVTLWGEAQSTNSPKAGASILMDGQGKLRQDALARLLSERDNRSVTIKE